MMLQKVFFLKHEFYSDASPASAITHMIMFPPHLLLYIQKLYGEGLFNWICTYKTNTVNTSSVLTYKQTYTVKIFLKCSCTKKIYGKISFFNTLLHSNLYIKTIFLQRLLQYSLAFKIARSNVFYSTLTHEYVRNIEIIYQEYWCQKHWSMG